MRGEREDYATIQKKKGGKGSGKKRLELAPLDSIGGVKGSEPRCKEI